jgi:hypothetical protein
MLVIVPLWKSRWTRTRRSQWKSGLGHVNPFRMPASEQSIPGLEKLQAWSAAHPDDTNPATEYVLRIATESQEAIQKIDWLCNRIGETVHAVRFVEDGKELKRLLVAYVDGDESVRTQIADLLAS